MCGYYFIMIDFIIYINMSLQANALQISFIREIGEQFNSKTDILVNVKDFPITLENLYLKPVMVWWDIVYLTWFSYVLIYKFKL